MIKRWTKNKTYITAGIVLFLAILYTISFFTFIKPMEKEIKSQEQIAAMYEKQLQKSDASTGEMESTKEDQLLKKQLPINKSPDDLLLKLQKIANSTQVTIDFIGTEGVEEAQEEEEDKDQEAIAASIFALDVQAATLADMHSFLDGIKESERLITIETLKIQQTTEQTNATIQLKTYSQG